MKPIVSIVGKKKVGKTTFLEKLIPELRRRGYRVATIKHDVHGFEIDHPGKDTWRFRQAGSDAVVIASSDCLALIRNWPSTATLADVATALGSEYDVILTEGYRRSATPKIEVSRRIVADELICQEQELIAVVSDQTFHLAVPHFNLDDAPGVADLLERLYLTRS